MKKLAITFAIVITLIIGGFLLALYNLNSIIATLKPQLEAIASDAIQTPVTLGELKASVFPTVEISADTVMLGKDAEKFELKNLSAQAELWPIFSKKLIITELSLNSPVIAIVKDATGVKIPGAPKTQANSDTSKTSPAVQSSSIPIAVSLERISIKNGTLTFDDTTSQKKFVTSDINLSAALKVEGKKGTLSDLTLKAKPMEAVSSGTIRSDLVSFSLEDGFSASGIFQLEGFDGTFGTYKVTDLKAKSDTKIAAAKQSAAVKEYSLNINGSPIAGSLQADLTKEGLRLSEFKAELLGGSLSAPVTLNFGDGAFSSPFTLTSLDIATSLVFLQGGGDPKLFGTIANVSGKVGGKLGADLKNSLQGSFRFNLTDGGIKGVNIGGLALKEVKDLPIVSGALFNYVPESYRSLLQDESTEFSSLTGNASLSGGRLFLSDVKLVSKLYTLDAKGNVGFDSSMDMDATIEFTKELSDGLAAASPGFKRILSANGTLIFPLTIRGTLPKVAVIPNLSKVLEIAGKKVLKDQATRALDKILGGKGRSEGLGNLLNW